MIDYNYTIEKVESGEEIHGGCYDKYDEIRSPLDRLLNISQAIRRYVEAAEMIEGDITEIKATRCKDGTIIVNITGARDRIIAKVWRATE